VVAAALLRRKILIHVGRWELAWKSVKRGQRLRVTAAVIVRSPTLIAVIKQLLHVRKKTEFSNTSFKISLE
jgi:hypothetical protein